MSNNDLWCSKCNSQHHPAEDCDGDKHTKMAEGMLKQAIWGLGDGDEGNLYDYHVESILAKVLEDKERIMQETINYKDKYHNRSFEINTLRQKVKELEEKHKGMLVPYIDRIAELTKENERLKQQKCDLQVSFDLQYEQHRNDRKLLHEYRQALDSVTVKKIQAEICDGLNDKDTLEIATAIVKMIKGE